MLELSKMQSVPEYARCAVRSLLIMAGLYVIAVIVALWRGLGFVDALSRPFEKWVAFTIILGFGFVMCRVGRLIEKK
jgi:heme/copper-type cytochrome/quinol oxidase subunit 3